MAEYKINYTQSNFTGGIIAAELYGRNDFSKVKTGLKKCTNWTIREAGGLEFRRGTKYLHYLPITYGNKFKMASLDKQVFFFCEDRIRYLRSDNTWDFMPYPDGILPDLSKLQFTELNRRLYYYDGNIKMCEIVLVSGIPSTHICKFETAITDATIRAERAGVRPDVYVPYEHKYTFSLAKNSQEETICIQNRSEEGYWTPIVPAVDLGSHSWVSVAYNGSRFVALGNTGYISVSSDGTSWIAPTQISALSSYYWSAIGYGNSMFIALSGNGYISTSTDGVTWTAATQVANLGSNSWHSITYDGSKFVALGRNGYISTSTDGTTWTAATQVANLGSNNWNVIAYGDSKFVALGRDGHLSTSTDGTTWTAASTSSNLYGVYIWQGLIYDGTKFIALGGAGDISTSTDGITWRMPTRSSSMSSISWMGLAGDSLNLVALKADGLVALSSDAISWNVLPRTSTLDAHNWNTVTYDGTKYVALGEQGAISTSDDGIIWTAATENANLGHNNWQEIIYDGSGFVALGTDGYISTSTNGTTWTAATQVANLGSNNWYSIAYDGSKFVALGRDGHISTSTDGTTWTAATQVANLGSNNWYSIAYDGSKFVALSYYGHISTSTDGTTWTAATQVTNLGSRMWYSIVYDGSRFVALGFSGYTSTSTDGTTWEAAIQNEALGNNRWKALILDGPAYIALGSNGYVSRYITESASVIANVELVGANSSEGKGQQVNVIVNLTQDLATEYNGGKIYIYKFYQGYFYFLSALDISNDKISYMFEDIGQLTPDLSKTPKENPSYIESDGSISTVNSIADYNQRLFLTRTNNNVTQIIFSAIGNTDSFAYSAQRSENEAGNLELPISNYDSWCKVASGLDLILSTSYTVSKVSGYGDLQTETILWDGLSKTVDPVRTRRSLIYTNSSNRNIYDLTYNEYGQYDSIDLTLLIKYIFETKTIKRLAFKDYPVKTIYVLCEDGDLYCLTYIKDQNIYAWYKIEHEGKITDICVVNTDTEDEVYIVVDYGNEYFVERAYHRTDNIYLDCAVTKQMSDINNNTITGLTMFNGRRVRVFDTGNNYYYGDYDIMNPKTVVEGGKTVEIDDLDFNGYLVTNGTIQLPDDVELVGPVIIGLPYYAVMETIPLEFQDQNGNSTIGRKKAVNDAYLRYGDSRGLTYKTMGHEYDCGICERDIADNAQFLERGQVKLHTVSEYRWDSTIKILQRQPYPARIESITLGITFNDKS